MWIGYYHLPKGNQPPYVHGQQLQETKKVDPSMAPGYERAAMKRAAEWRALCGEVLASAEEEMRNVRIKYGLIPPDGGEAPFPSMLFLDESRYKG